MGKPNGNRREPGKSTGATMGYGSASESAGCDGGAVGHPGDAGLQRRELGTALHGNRGGADATWIN